MNEVKGMRFGRRDKDNRIRVVVPKGIKIEINGIQAELKTSTTVFVDSHEDASKILNSKD